MRTIIAAIGACMGITFAMAATSAARLAPAVKCEAGKNLAIGKYELCLHKAHQKLVKGGGTDIASFDEAVIRCENKYADQWQKLESDGGCPGAEAEIKDFVDACVLSVADALGGGTLGLDPLICNSQLTTCNEDLAVCQAAAICGNGRTDASEVCDTSGNSSTCDFNCSLPLCGDGIVNGSFTPAGAPGPEQCDDGNTSGGDGCSALCQIEFCGNGITETLNAEQCDDGNGNDLDACRNNCQSPRCGDGVASASEVCDTSGNSPVCDFNCSLPLCGDGVVNRSFAPVGAPGPEQCDDSNTSGGDGCSALCQIEFCGNGITETLNAEQCDDGNGNDLDACRNNCQSPRCGDGVASTSEVCDTSGNSATCDYNCSFPLCGDGLVNGSFVPAGAPGGEQCDDGNTSGGDGCSTLCQIEP